MISTTSRMHQTRKGRIARERASKDTLREALRRLEAERLVTIRPNRGPVVTNISWEEARQIYYARALLEGEAATLFAAHASAAALRALKDALADFQRGTKSNNALQRLSATERFYDVILRNCGNKIIAEMLQGLVARITFLRSRSMSRPGEGKRGRNGQDRKSDRSRRCRRSPRSFGRSHPRRRRGGPPSVR
jgi:DNA-binding GntR family transcriptional regulator